MQSWHVARTAVWEYSNYFCIQNEFSFFWNITEAVDIFREWELLFHVIVKQEMLKFFTDNSYTQIILSSRSSAKQDITSISTL